MSLSPLQRLQNAEQTIHQICQVAGIAAASVGVLHQGSVIYTKHFGFRDLERQLKPDDETLYGLGSVSKGLTALAVTKLVSEGALDWSTPVKHYIPDLNTRSGTLNAQATLIDLLAHRIGLTGAFHLAWQGNGKHLIEKKDYLALFNHLVPVTSLRDRWIYNSWGYSVVQEIIEKVSGQPIHVYLDKAVFGPLQLRRTTTQPDFETTPNLAEPYSTLANGKPFHLPYRQDFRNSLFEAAAGVYSSLHDVLHYCEQNLIAYQSLTYPKGMQSPNSNIREPATLFSSHIPIINPAFRERSYALGWIRTQLPGEVGLMGDNLRLMDVYDMPTLGDASKPRLTLYHQGATVGYFPSLYIFPETQSAVVVLTNTIALGDAADWIAQALAEQLFDDDLKQDWIAISRKTKNNILEKYADMRTQLEKGRPVNATPAPLEQYVGDYFDATGLFFIRVALVPGSKTIMTIKFQGLEDQAYQLRFYDEDVFEWLLTRDETAKRGRYHMFQLSYFILRFHRDANGAVKNLSWHHDANHKEPEAFKKG